MQRKGRWTEPTRNREKASVNQRSCRTVVRLEVYQCWRPSQQLTASRLKRNTNTNVCKTNGLFLPSLLLDTVGSGDAEIEFVSVNRPADHSCWSQTSSFRESLMSNNIFLLLLKRCNQWNVSLLPSSGRCEQLQQQTQNSTWSGN